MTLWGPRSSSGGWEWGSEAPGTTPGSEVEEVIVISRIYYYLDAGLEQG
jgi:hypothetical protein